MMRGIIDDLRKTLSELCKKLQTVGFPNVETLVPQRGNPVTFQRIKVCWCRGVDIYGCLLSRKIG